MFTLANLQAEQEAIIKQIHAQGELKKRLFSFGLRKATRIKVKAISFNKSTMEIEIGTSFLALRLEEASSIEVSKI